MFAKSYAETSYILNCTYIICTSLEYQLSLTALCPPARCLPAQQYMKKIVGINIFFKYKWITKI